MATYRFEANIIGRSKGRSSTASAAYRAAMMIEDRRTGEVFDYTRKSGVLHTEIMAPPATPAWMLDRAELWNAVEKTEKRKDSQLARAVVLSLPHELTHQQRCDLVRDFVQQEFVGKGMVADIAIHAPDRRGDNRNHHAHVMLTMRSLTGDGFGPKVRDWNSTEQLEHWREQWAHAVNTHLERAGHTARVDHRSNDAQGNGREPEPKQGPIATQMEREGRRSHAGTDRRATQDRNDRRTTLTSELAAITAEIISLDRDDAQQAIVERPEGIQPTSGPVGNIEDPEERYKKLRQMYFDAGSPYASLAEAAKAEHDAFARGRRNLENQIADATDPKQRHALELRKEIEAADYMAITDRRIAKQHQFVGGRDSSEASRVNDDAQSWEDRGRELRRQLLDHLAGDERHQRLMNTPTKDLTPEERRDQRREILRQATEKRPEIEPQVKPPDIDRER